MNSHFDNRRRGRAPRDRVADAISTLAGLPQEEFDAVQECVIARACAVGDDQISKSEFVL